MEKALEKALIRTFKKIKESDVKGSAEISGLFINFYYAETGTHGGLDTRDYVFTIDSNTGVMYIVSPDRWYYHVLAKDLKEQLNQLSLSDYYSLWLRAEFEDPKNEQYGNSLIKEAFKDYKGIEIESKTSNYGHNYNDPKFWEESYKHGRISKEQLDKTLNALSLGPIYQCK